MREDDDGVWAPMGELRREGDVGVRATDDLRTGRVLTGDGVGDLTDGNATAGSSGPNMLGLRCGLILALGLRCGDAWTDGDTADAVFTTVRVDRRRGFVFSGDVTGDVTGGGVGELGLTRGFLALLLRILSSSSEDVTSERLEQSTLIESECLFEMDP